MQPTLRRRMIIYLALMASGSLLIGVAAIVGVNGVHDDLSVALQGNQQLRQVYEIGSDATTARRALGSIHPDPSAALASMQAALARLDASNYCGPGTPLHWVDESKKAQCESLLEDAAGQLKRPAVGDPDTRDAQASAINAVLGELANLSSEVRATILSRQQAADGKRRHTLDAIILLSVTVLLGAILIGFGQYRSVMQPLDKIRRGVRNFSSRQLAQRIPATGDREFASLADDFNIMAAELEGLYHQLEEKVAVKSKELVRSERLASVGYLAAGVAHEMNNPLGIIAGYGERALQHLARGLDENTLPSAQRAIKIMCEEAFRCKEITEHLLSLARPGAGDRLRVSIPELIAEVIANLGGLPEYADRRITLEAPAKANLLAIASDGELRQVFLNLMLNALQATSPGTGQVHVSVIPKAADIEINITDNGIGMTPEILDRAFEPFFTEKRGRQRPGTGLGLSITHAIILDHGGRISAHSDGPGKGSRFSIRLPAVLSHTPGKGAELADVA